MASLPLLLSAFIYVEVCSFLFSMYGCFDSMYGCAPCVCLMPEETRRRSPGTGAGDCYGCRVGARNLIHVL